MRRPNKRNWKNAIKPAFFENNQKRSPLDAREYWVRSYNLDGEGSWLYRALDKQDMITKYMEDVDSAKFWKVEKGFLDGYTSVIIDTWRTEVFDNCVLTT